MNASKIVPLNVDNSSSKALHFCNEFFKIEQFRNSSASHDLRVIGFSKQTDIPS
jgi:hypothetical protein